jgi:hypothetical protein
MKLEQLLISIDQVFNAIFGGMADETLSARAYRKKSVSKKWYIAYKVINKIFFWQKDHCYEAYLSEMNRKQLPAEYQK